MWTLMWPVLAIATPVAPFPRATEVPEARFYGDVAGDGPALGKWRRRSGPISAWVFEDGTIEHYERWEKKHIAERHIYDAVGRPLATVMYEDGAPSEVRVQSPDGALVPLIGWTPHEVGGWKVLAPPGATTVDASMTWTDGTRTVRVSQVSTGADPLSASYAAGLDASCGCVIEGRTTAWIDGLPGSLYQLRYPDPAGDRLGSLWAVALEGTALLVAVTAPASVPEGTGALGFGRAILALTQRPTGDR